MKQINYLSIFCSILFFGLTSCQKEETTTPDQQKSIVVNSSIYKNTTFKSDSLYIIDGDVEVGQNAVLTIQPGAVIKFTAGSSLSIGYSATATLIAKGTKSKPIRFTSNAASPTAGAYDGLLFYDATQSNTILRNCILEYAGGNGAAITMYDCQIAMDSCVINHSAGYGVSCNSGSSFTSLIADSIVNVENHSLSILANFVHTIGERNKFDVNHGIEVYGSFNQSSAKTWKKLNVPYIVDDVVSIDGDLTIEAGTTIQFGASGYFMFGYNASTKITAVGTSTAPVTFTSSAVSPTPGAWKGLEFYENTQTNTSMKYCKILYSGKNNDPAIQMYSSSINFTNDTIKFCNGVGLSLNGTSGFISFNNNYVSCADHVISISAQHVPELGVPNTFVPGTNKGIEVYESGNYASAVTWKKQNAANFYIDNVCALDGSITFEAGSTFKMGASGYFMIGYNKTTTLTAVGTSSNPITFTSASVSPAAGDWKGFEFYDNSSANTTFNYCNISYSGKGNSNSIVMYSNSHLIISNSQINNHGGTAAKALYQGTAVVSGTGNNFTWSHQ